MQTSDLASMQINFCPTLLKKICQYDLQSLTYVKLCNFVAEIRDLYRCLAQGQIDTCDSFVVEQVLLVLGSLIVGPCRGGD